MKDPKIRIPMDPALDGEGRLCGKTANPESRYVIAVAAPIGGGKTSLVKAIAAGLEDATAIYFDSYETMTQWPVDELVQWVENGADFDALSVPNLAADLDRLKRGETVFDPMSHREIPSGKYILFEMPLGREYKETAGLIDLLIWVDVPLDIALARKIKEFTIGFPDPPQPEEMRNFAAWLNGYLENYLRVVRRVLQIQKDRVGPGADIVLDGQADFKSIIRDAAGEILRRIP